MSPAKSIRLELLLMLKREFLKERYSLLLSNCSEVYDSTCYVMGPAEIAAKEKFTRFLFFFSHILICVGTNVTAKSEEQSCPGGGTVSFPCVCA